MLYYCCWSKNVIFDTCKIFLKKLNDFRRLVASTHAGGRRARSPKGLCAVGCVCAEKVLQRRLRGVWQIVVFTVRKLVVFSGRVARHNGDTSAPLSWVFFCICLFWFNVQLNLGSLSLLKVFIKLERAERSRSADMTRSCIIAGAAVGSVTYFLVFNACLKEDVVLWTLIWISGIRGAINFGRFCLSCNLEFQLDPFT